jgi:4-amino-4-deoxy-L-arabinose transferase-like glycosyltransferase
MKNPLPAAVWLILLLALLLRVGYVAATPDMALVNDATDYDKIAASIARGEGYPELRGRPTAFRPPGYPLLLAGTYTLAGARDEAREQRVPVARALGVGLGTLVVALLGLVATQLWGRTVGLIAMGLGAIYVPLITVGGAVMSETLFAALLLGALAAALQRRRSVHTWRWVIAAGVLTGLAGLTRPNAMVLLLPLAVAVWTVRPRLSPRALVAPAALVAVALLTVSPWTIRNAIVLDHFIPFSTQPGSALAGTYNDESRTDRENPASWRSIKHIDAYLHLWRNLHRLPEPAVEDELAASARRFIREHPGYVATVAWWNTRRMLDLAGVGWWRHTAATISIRRGWADAGVYCFWVFALLAVVGAATRRARRTPLLVWAIPVLLYLSVVFLVVETPRYRTGIDLFIVMLAALALRRALPDAGDREPPPPGPARYRTSPKAPTPA